MSSMTSTVISLLFILYLGSEGQEFMRKTICEDKIPYIDGIVEFESYRYFLIGDKFFEYDKQFNFRRQGVLVFDVEEFNQNEIGWHQHIEKGRYLSGIFLPKIDCNQFKDIENCAELDDTLSNVEVVVIFNHFTNQYMTVSKKLDIKDNIYYGIRECLGDANVANISTEHRQGPPDYGQEDTDPQTTELNGCGPYNFDGRSQPNDWLLQGLEYNKRHKYLPLFYDPKNLELLVILNKEYEMFGDNPSLIREHSRVYWKSLKYDNGHGWEDNGLSDDYTYTAFLRVDQKVYLIAEKFEGKPEIQRERGSSVMLLFDLGKKQVIEDTKKNLLDLFGCSFGASNLVGYIVIGVMVFILLMVIFGWIFACYWFYGNGGKTTYNQSIQLENTN